DALDDRAVNVYIDSVVGNAGQIDIVFTAVGPLANEYGNTKHATDLTIDEFMLPLTTVVKSQFIAARVGGASHDQAAVWRHRISDRESRARSRRRRDCHWHGVRRDRVPH